MEVLEALTVCPHLEGFFGALKPVPLLFKGQLDGQQLTFPHVVVLFCSREMSREESTGVNSPFIAVLAEDHSHSCARGIDLYNEGLVRIRSMENGCR